MRLSLGASVAALALTASAALTGPLTAAATAAGTAQSDSRLSPRATQASTLAARSATTVPRLRVTRTIAGLNLPWDVKQLPSGRLLVTERESKRLLTYYRGKVRRVAFPTSTVWVGSETGLMSLAIDPGFRKNRRFYTCQGGRTANGGHDVRVFAWRLGTNATGVRLLRTLVTGLPSTSGRHGGCRLLIPKYGALLIGTGDAATGTNSQNLASLGGKILRVDRTTGAPWPGNPFVRSANPRTRLVLTYGHRNVQGLAQRSDGTIWSVEHGPDRDDEINLVSPGANYGWNPVPGYNESVPMTDQSLPGTQTPARWSSGFPTIATSGASWVSGPAWGVYNGSLAVAALKGERLTFFRFDSAGRFQSLRTPAELRRFGRLRSVTRLQGGDLAVTTANGDGHDSVLRVHPVG